jgi:hypothetical protein
MIEKRSYNMTSQHHNNNSYTCPRAQNLAIFLLRLAKPRKLHGVFLC